MPRKQKTNSNRGCSWTKCSTQYCCGWVFDWRLMEGDTNCGKCGCKYLTCERNAWRQQNDNAKDLFKEVLQQLSEAAREKLKIPLLRPSQALEPSKPTFRALQQKLHQMNLKMDKQAHQVTQAHVKADTEFEKLIALKQEYLRLQQELAMPYVTNTAEPIVLPQPALADEPTKAELCELAENPTLLVRQRHPKVSLNDETDTDSTEREAARGPEATAEGLIYW